jgi:tetratricopeptide (TPR) repeat protein
VLAARTRAAVAGLAPAKRDLLVFLCCLEEADRIRPVLDGNWAALWRRLSRAGEPPGWDARLASLAAAGLVAVQPGSQQTAESYGIDPGVAAAGRDVAGEKLREAVDTELAGYWTAVADRALRREAEEQTGERVVRAGLGAAPYLLRLHRWREARGLLGRVLTRDSSRATAQAALPALRAIAAAVAGTDGEPGAALTLARALDPIDPAEAERQTREVLAAALARQDYMNAATAASHLAVYRTRAMRLGEALKLAEEAISYTRRTGAGPWTQLDGEVQRLQVLTAMGEDEQVLAEALRLRKYMETLPAGTEQPETAEPWSVRELLLDVAGHVALRLSRWDEALRLNAAIVASMRGRGAPDTEIARTRFNDHGPLTQLGHPDEALALLVECRDVFEQAHDVRGLGNVLGALANAESERGNADVATGLARDALRYSYLAGDVGGIQIDHHNLGVHLARASEPGAALAHHLAAALLRAVAGAKGEELSIRAAAVDLNLLGDDNTVPASIAELCGRVGESLGGLLAQLDLDPQAIEQRLAKLIEDVRAQAHATATAPSVIARILVQWDPVIAGLVAAAKGDTQAVATVRDHLVRHEDSPDWAALTGTLRRILEGDRGQGGHELTAGLHPIAAAITRRALDALAGRIRVPAALWPAIGLGALLGDIVAAVDGDTDATGRARKKLDSLAGDPPLAVLAWALNRILEGEHDPGLATLGDPVDQAVVVTVLHYIEFGASTAALRTARGGRMGVRDERLAAVQARLGQVGATRDLAPVLEPGARAEARRLTEMLEDDDGDLYARYGLGWFHLYRYEALPQGQGRQDLDTALAMFTPCYIVRVPGIPKPLLPLIAERAAAAATAMLKQAFSSPSEDLISATVDLWKQILQDVGENHPGRGYFLADLGTTLQLRFDRTGVLADLEAAIEVAQRAVRLIPDLPRRGHFLSNLGRALQNRFERSGAQEDLDAAIEAARAAVAATRIGNPDRTVMLSNLARALQTRFEHRGAEADLDSAIQVLEEAVAAIPRDHSDRAPFLSSLAHALRTRFEHRGAEADLDSAIQVFKDAIAIVAPDHPGHAELLSNLGIALQARFKRRGTEADLDTAVQVLQEAVATAARDYPDRAAFLSNLGGALGARFERRGTEADLDAGIQVLEEAVSATPVGHPSRTLSLSNLAGVLRARFYRHGTLADLDTAIEVLTEAVTATPDGHPDRATFLFNLGGALRDRFERSGMLTDLESAVEVARSALAATPEGHPSRAEYLSGLGRTLRIRFERCGSLSDLDTAIEVLTEAVTATPDGHTERAGSLVNLGNALMCRFQRTGSLADLDTAIEVLTEAVTATPDGHPDRAVFLNSLGGALRDRFERRGVLADLDRAIEFRRAALAAIADDHPDRAMYLSNIGSALESRFERVGMLADLDAAIHILQEAVTATPPDDPDRAMHLSSLGSALRNRFERTGTQADLEAAIRATQEAVDATPADHPDRVQRLNNLGAALQARFGRTGTLADLDTAIHILQEAVTATPNDHPYRPGLLSNLGGALQDRFDRSGMLADSDAAIKTIEEAVTGIADDDPRRAICLLNLGDALTRRFLRTRAQADLDATLSVLGQVVEADLAVPSFRVHAAHKAALLAASSQPSWASQLLERAVELLPELAPRHLYRSDQQYSLGRLAGLAGDAAAFALADTAAPATERATRALRLLEAGRAVLLSQALDTRSDLTDLRQKEPELAARFVELRDRLDQPSDVTSADTTMAYDITAMLDVVPYRRQLTEEFAATLARIRALGGFASFGLPPTTDELLAQAVHGPVVVFNVSPYRSDALLLTKGGITSLPLPALTPNEVYDQIDAFYQALHTATDPEASSPDRKIAQARLREVLEWLWDRATEPVLETLGYRSQPAEGESWPRVWWAPGGWLSLLPIHAAGYHTDPPSEQGRRTIMDRVISSYTPTIRALRYARQHSSAAVPASRALIVAMPTTPGVAGRLHHVPAETALLRSRLPRPVLLAEPDALEGEAEAQDTPTKANVLTRLPECSIAHFACHGASNPADPSKSMLLLRDHDSDPFTVASLAPVSLEHARLVYLSACSTAITADTRLLDEGIHLTSAFQLAGFPHVIGTLWEIDDALAVSVADNFYTALRGTDGALDTIQAAHALHHAVRALRDKIPATPSLWAAYVHAGS